MSLKLKKKKSNQTEHDRTLPAVTNRDHHSWRGKSECTFKTFKKNGIQPSSKGNQGPYLLKDDSKLGLFSLTRMLEVAGPNFSSNLLQGRQTQLCLLGQPIALLWLWWPSTHSGLECAALITALCNPAGLGMEDLWTAGQAGKVSSSPCLFFLFPHVLLIVSFVHIHSGHFASRWSLFTPHSQLR